MRIYVHEDKFINGLDVQKIKKYLIKTLKHFEIYSEEGVFRVDNSNIYKLHITNERSETFQYESKKLLIHYTDITEEKVNQIPVEHIPMHVNYDFYSLDSKSEVKFVVKSLEKENKQKVIDAYFELDDTVVDPKRESILNEIQQFLCFVCKSLISSSNNIC
jgi:hypothetical protein